MTIQDICASFEIGGKYIDCTELSTGIINNTYHVRFLRDNEEKHYIVQKINTKVFKNPEKLMNNIVAVTNYIRGNIAKRNLSTKRFVLRAFLAKETGKPIFKDTNGEFWRIYRFIPNCITYDKTDSLDIIKNTGVAFGRFQDCLDGFDASNLYCVIPNFHNTPSRYKAFKKQVKKDSYKRAKSVQTEIDKLLSFEEMASKIKKYLDMGELPLRVTHNDTKFNNVAFDKTTGEPLAVLDLDTVMSGAIAYDFGDAIRFIANTRLEDDPYVEKVAISLDKYRAFTQGFFDEMRGKLTEFETKTLNLGVFTMTVELAVRFLTDYLQGDKYFKTRYPGHNLDRVRNQIALAEDILRKYDEMEEILFHCKKGDVDVKPPRKKKVNFLDTVKVLER